MRVCVYTRVSTDEQAESLKNQAVYFDDYLKKNTHFTPFREDYIFSDLGLTGTKLNNRPSFFEMLRSAGLDVSSVSVAPSVNNGNRDGRKKHIETVFSLSDRQPLFDLILLKNTSRFARNTLSFDIINKLRRKGVHILFIEQNINTSDISNDFFLKLFQLFDEQDSRDKSLKVKTGIKASNIKNTIRTTSRIYGYIYHKEDNSLEIIPHEAEVIRQIYAYYLDGLGIRQIVNKLTADGITTREGRPFCKSSVRRILTNEKYKGMNALSKYSTGSVFNKFSYPHIVEQYEVVENDRIPAIVSCEDFDKVQSMFASKVNHKLNKGTYNGISKYNSRVVCGCCGSPYYSNRDRGRIFYVCKNKKMNGTSACDNMNISEKKLDAYLDEVFLSSSELIKEKKNKYKYYILHIINKLIDSVDLDNRVKIEEAQEHIKELETRLSRLMNLYSLNLGGVDVLLHQIQELDEELTRKRSDLLLLTAPEAYIKDEVLAYKKQFDRIAEVPDYFETAEDLLQYIRIEVIGDDLVVDLFPEGFDFVKVEDLERFGLPSPFYTQNEFEELEDKFFTYLSAAF